MSAKATRWIYDSVDLAVGQAPVSDLASMLDAQEGKVVQELQDWIASKVLGCGKPAQTANSEGTANPEGSAVPEGGHHHH